MNFNSFLSNDLSNLSLDEENFPLSFDLNGITQIREMASTSDIEFIFSPTKFLSSSKKDTDKDKYIKELELKYKEHVRLIMKKLKQKNEELEVHKKLTNTRENRESELQDQLNKTTIELAQIRLSKDDLTSSLKQSSAKNQYLTKELEKINSILSKNEEDKNKEISILNGKIDSNLRETENMRNDYELKNEKLKAKNRELKHLLEVSKSHFDQIQDENYRLISESRKIEQQYEADKSEHIRDHSHLSELQAKFDKVQKDFVDFRDMNEKLNFSLLQMKNDLKTMEAENKRVLMNKKIIETKAKTLNEQLEEANQIAQQSQLALQNENVKIRSLQEEITQNQQLLNKTKSNLINDINNLLQQIQKEQSANEKLKEKYRKLEESFFEQNRELEHEKSIREKIEKSEKNLMQRLNQLELINQENDTEREQLKKHNIELNKELDSQTELNVKSEEKLKNSLNQNLLLNEKNRLLEMKMEQNLTSVNTETYEELRRKLDDALTANSSMSEAIKNLQNQIKESNIKIEHFFQEKQNDTQIIDELRETLKKEVDNLTKSIHERKEIQEKSQNLIIENSILKKKNCENETSFSLAKRENDHLQKVIEEKQQVITSLADSNSHLQLENNKLSDLLRNEKITNSATSMENDSLKQEIVSTKKELGLTKANNKTLLKKVEENGNLIESLNQAKQIAVKESENNRNKLVDITNLYEEMRSQMIEERKEKEKFVLKSNKLSSQLNSLSSSLKSSEKQLSLIKQQMNSKTNQVSELQMQVEQLKSLNDQINTENDSLQNEKSRHMNKIEDLQKRLREELDIQSDLRAQQVFETAQEKIERLVKSNKNLTEKLNESEQNHHESTEHIEELHGVIKSLQNEIEKSQNATSKYEEEIFELNKKVSEKEAFEKKYLLNNKDINKLMNEIRNENKKMREQITFLEEKNSIERLQLESLYFNNLEALKNKHKQENEEIENLNAIQKEKIQNLQQNLASRKKDILKLEIALTDSNQKLNSAKTNLKSAKKQLDELLHENNDLKANLFSQIQQFNQLDKQNKKIFKDRNQLIDKISSLSSENDELSIVQKKYYNASAKLEQTECEMRKMKSQIDILTSLNESLRIEIGESQKTNNNTTSEFEKISDTVQNIQSLISGDSNQLDNSNNSHTLKIYESSYLTSKFLNELTEIRENMANSSKTSEEMINNKKNLIQEVGELRKTITDLQMSNRETSNELSIIANENNGFINENKNLKKENTRFSFERDNLTNGIEELKGALRTTNENLNMVIAEKKKLKNENSKLRFLLRHSNDMNKDQKTEKVHKTKEE